MVDLGSALVAAVVRQRLMLDEMKAIWDSREECEAIANYYAGLTVDDALPVTTPEPCWKDHRPGHYVDRYDEPGWVGYRPGTEARAAFIAEHWCAACQRNEVKVAAYYRLQKQVGGRASAIAQMARRVAKTVALPATPAAGGREEA